MLKKYTWLFTEKSRLNSTILLKSYIIKDSHAQCASLWSTLDKLLSSDSLILFATGKYCQKVIVLSLSLSQHKLILIIFYIVYQNWTLKKFAS